MLIEIILFQQQKSECLIINWFLIQSDSLMRVILVKD